MYSDIKELLTDAKNLASGANDLQLKGVLLDIQGAVYDLQEENKRLKEDNSDLKNAQRLTTELIFKDNAYYKWEEGPYCSACWDSKNLLVRMILEANGWNEYFIGRCPHCKNSITTTIKDPDYKDL
ncbi:hypothetical protein [Carnobacterium sp. TMP28]|uniref:hypothetical protein n=1 Tax=Carnobacterium sp. TMP28 TaxID=3397060 RepID=UPI0039E09C6E